MNKIQNLYNVLHPGSWKMATKKYWWSEDEITVSSQKKNPADLLERTRYFVQ